MSGEIDPGNRQRPLLFWNAICLMYPAIKENKRHNKYLYTYFNHLLPDTMKKGIILVLSVLLFACQENKAQQEKKDSVQNSVEKAGQNLKDAAHATGDYLGTERDSLRAALKVQISKVDKKMGELKDDGSVKATETKKHLQIWKDSLNSKMSQVQNVSADKWEDTKAGTNRLLDRSNRTWDKLKQGVRDAFSDKDSTKKDN